MSGRRAGVTLIEAVFAIALLAAVTGLIAGALARAQREFRESEEVRTVRADLRDAAAILGRELRATSVRGDTLRLVSDTAVEFFAPIMTGVVCAAGSADELPLAYARERGTMSLTSSVAVPDTGDLAWVWQRDSSGELGWWRRFRVTGFSETGSRACAASFGATALAPSLRIAGDGAAILGGAPIHVVRRGRYSVYRASDREWYLGYRRCDALGGSSCRIVQPVAGPYRAGTGGVAGIRFRYLDETGAELAAGLGVTGTARIEIIVRSDTARMPFRVGPTRTLADSALATVAFRNFR